MEASDSSGALVVTLPKEYPLVILSCCIITSLCYFIGMIGVAVARSRAFTDEFMAGFKQEHADAVSGEPARLGYPDCGEGRYAKKLEYGSWVSYCNAQRVHNNFVEGLPLTLTVLLVGGLFLPVITTIVGFVVAGARLVYTIMYLTTGSDARKIGSILGNLPLYLLMLTNFVYGIVKVCQ